jgi:hypothetical protein
MAIPPALPTVSRYDYALGKVESTLKDPIYPEESRDTKKLFNWVEEYVNKEKKATVRSRYKGH